MAWSERGRGYRQNLRCIFTGIPEDEEVLRERRDQGRPGLAGVVRAAGAHGVCLRHSSSLGPFRWSSGASASSHRCRRHASCGKLARCIGGL